MSWDSEKVEQMLALLKSGMRPKLVGQQIGMTKNAVIGKCRRMGVELQDGKAGRPRTQVKQDRPRNHRPKRSSVSLPADHVPQARLEPVTKLPFRAITLVELKENDCRYPHGNGPFFFCGQQKMEEGSYCEFHHRLTTRVTPSTAATFAFRGRY